MKIGMILAAGAAAVGFGVAMTPGVAQATSPGRDGLLAFVNMTQIITAKTPVSGDFQYRALTVSGDNRGPRWSPDGSRLAYYTKQGAIRTMSPTGAARKTLVLAGGYQPAWDGNATIAFVKVTNKKGDIYAVSATGGPVRRLTTDGASGCGNLHPAFSADGRYFAYEQYVHNDWGCTNEVQLKVVDRTTQTSRVYTDLPEDCLGENPDPGRVDFTADSKHVLYGVCIDSNFPVLDLTTGAVTSIYAPSDPWNGYGGPAPAPLPSGGTTFDEPYDAANNVVHFDDADVQPLSR